MKTVPMSEFAIVKDVTQKLGLTNQTDGTLFIYPKSQNTPQACKPDGYYFYDGITFILDAKAFNKPLQGQIKDYLKQEPNPLTVGLAYNGITLETYINNQLIPSENHTIYPASYYLQTYFANQKRHNFPDVVNKYAKQLAKLFRDAKIDKQTNVPLIGAILLGLSYLNPTFKTTQLYSAFDYQQLLMTIKTTLVQTLPSSLANYLITIINQTINNDHRDQLNQIVQTIVNINNFINVYDQSGYDTMNGFLKIFRKWNSADASDKGEVFTPDHISQVMFDLLDIDLTNPNLTLIDPTCGSGTFLINSKFLKPNLRVIGIEYNNFNYHLGLLNAALHRYQIELYQGDCFQILPTLNNTYDYALLNPPFSQADRELKFVYETLNHAKSGAKIAAIVPISSILSTTDRIKNHYKQLLLANHNLLAVVRLPKHLFFPNASVQCAIVVFQAHVPYQGQTKWKNFLDDGYCEKRAQGRIEVDFQSAYQRFINQDWIITTLDVSCDWPYYPPIEQTISDQSLTLQKFHSYIAYYQYLLKNNLDHNQPFVFTKPLSLTNVTTWATFKLKDHFQINIGKDTRPLSSPVDQPPNQIQVPLIVASKNHNGIGCYLTKGIKQFKANAITLVNQGDGAAGIAHCQLQPFYATASVFVLTNSQADQDAYCFISTVLSNCHQLFDYTYGLTLKRLEQLTITLPAKIINNKPTIDFELMSQIVKGSKVESAT